MMAITWSDTPYGVMPDMNVGEVGGYASAPLDWGFLPKLATQLGMPYNDIQNTVQNTAQGDTIDNSPQVAASWLQSQGYTPKTGQEGSIYYNGIFDKNGNLIASAGNDTSKSALADLTGLLTTVGLPALGGAALSGSLGNLGGIGDIFGGAAAPVAGNGAFLGEGIASGIPAWDSALANAVPGVISATPSVFNAAQDSQLANQQLGVTGAQAAAAATAPNAVDLGTLGGVMSTGVGATALPTLQQVQQGINAAKQLTGGNTPTIPTQANNSGLASLLGALGGLGGLGQQPGYAETAVNMGAINPFNVHGMDLATTPTTGIQAMPGQGQSPDLNTSAGLLRLLGITQ